MTGYKTITRDGQRYYIPTDLDPESERKRLNMWVAWQRAGLPLPNPSTGRAGLFARRRPDVVDIYGTFSGVPIWQRIPRRDGSDSQDIPAANPVNSMNE